MPLPDELLPFMPRKTVELGEEFTLKLNQVVKLKNEPIYLKLIHLQPYDSWTMTGGNKFSFKVGGYDYYRKSPYTYYTVDTDGEIYATMIIQKREVFCSERGGDYCFSEYAKDVQDISLCAKIEDLNIKSECMLKLASDLDQLDVCNEIPAGYYQNECFRRFSISEEDVAICDTIAIDEFRSFGISSRDECYLSVFNVTRDAGICEKISLQYIKDDCFEAAAKNNSDVEWCRKISESRDRDYCIYNVAIALNDKSLCESIEYVDVYTPVGGDEQSINLKEQCLGNL